MYPRTGLGFSGDFRLLMSTKGDDNCGSLAPPRGQYHICMFLLSIHMYMHVLFSFYFTYFSLFLVLIQRRKERGVGMGGFYREDFWDRLGFPRGFAFVGAAICRRFFFFCFFYELTSQRIWNFSIFTVAGTAFVVAVVVNVCSSHKHCEKHFW